MTLRIPDDMDAELRQVAAAAHVSINSFVVDALKERLAALHHEAVMAIARDVADKDAEILDRLANA